MIISTGVPNPLETPCHLPTQGAPLHAAGPVEVGLEQLPWTDLRGQRRRSLGESFRSRISEGTLTK